MAALMLAMCLFVSAQGQSGDESERFGPVVSAYLNYLDNEQNVVDDRVSRHEVTPAYYRRNSNRIRALRIMAMRIARETGNDYLPEFEAAARDELKTIFEHPPAVATLKPGVVVNGTFRFLGAVTVRETFFLFSRLDPYEQAEMLKKKPQPRPVSDGPPDQRENAGPVARPRRITSP